MILELMYFNPENLDRQSVNTTDSAVGYHIPTGIVVTCQDQKSIQLRNSEKAMDMLTGKLYLLEKERERSRNRGSKKISN